MCVCVCVCVLSKYLNFTRFFLFHCARDEDLVSCQEDIVLILDIVESYNCMFQSTTFRLIHQKNKTSQYTRKHQQKYQLRGLTGLILVTFVDASWVLQALSLIHI